MAGLERLKDADVIVYDRLVGAGAARRGAPEAERIFVGKVAGESHDQEAINRLLVEKAREGKRVVRLKGGDPFVFGRGGEEAEALRDGGRAVRSRAGRDIRGCGAGLRGDSGHAPRSGVDVRGDHRARGPREAGIEHRLGEAGDGGRHARLPDGDEDPAGDRREAHRERTAGGDAGRGDPLGDDAGPADGGRNARDILDRVGGGDHAARDHGRRRGRAVAREATWFEVRPLFGKRVW